MSKCKYVTLLMFVASILPIRSTAWAADGIFSGDWEYVERVAGASKPYSTFEIKLHEGRDGTVIGSYCFITQNGNRIDCDVSGAENISGHVQQDGQHAEVRFDSFFGAKDGFADLTSYNDTLTWRVAQNPKGDFFYGPYSVTLTRKEADARQGERQVVVDKAFLYPTPSETKVKTYIVKGEYVRLVNISDDMKFWKISYSEKNGVTIERWIDCRAINFCP
ncbi:hypothetical protein [Paraburkholderia ferrariae]|uniref:hypothetical protein n=1 Tax=Paraburkholderia ferrariae TaxID=386056 RepID=UPI0012EB2969|nr:hypothetical protein [Paraburkholderia ferrariae]